MRELNISECGTVCGGTIEVNEAGEVVHADGGVTLTMNTDGSTSMVTGDGWSYFKNTDSTWSLWNGDKMIGAGGDIYITNQP